MLPYTVIILILALAVTLLIRAEFAKNQKQIHVFKPVSTSLVVIIILAAFITGTPVDSGYRAGILAGLLLCFGGDMALMFQSQSAFRAGLVLFLLGHVAYSVVFILYSGFTHQDLLSGTVLLVLGGIIYAYLYPGLGNMKVSVLFYVVIISFMVNRAVSGFYGDFFSGRQAVLISGGAALFYISDVILAVSRFRKEYRYNRISLAFYYSGQVLIALSTAVF